MVVPNGKPTNLSEKQWVQVRTESFKNWFGDWENAPDNSSKVVDENGEPMVMYHATDEQFSTFDKTFLGDNTKMNRGESEDFDAITESSKVGFWFNNSPLAERMLSEYSMPCFLNIRDVEAFQSLHGLTTSVEYAESAEILRNELIDNGVDGIQIYEDEEFGGVDFIVFNPNQIKSAENNNGDFSESEDINYLDGESVEDINNKFNGELKQFISGKMKSNEMFHIGKPVGVLRYFLPDIEIVMHQKTLNKGIKKKHNIDIDKIKDLPSHISNPIFIFKKNNKSIGLFTEMEDKDGKNICVAIEINKTIQDGGKFYEVNDLRSLHGREIENIINPININGSLVFANIEKGSNWITSALHNFKQAQSNQNLSENDFISAAKKVKEFRNPTHKEGEIYSEIENLTSQLNSNVRVIRNVDEITDKDKRQERRKRGAKGWYDKATGEVVVVIDNATSIADVHATILHEFVGHKELQELPGDKYDTFISRVFFTASPEVRKAIGDLIVP